MMRFQGKVWWQGRRMEDHLWFLLQTPETLFTLPEGFSSHCPKIIWILYNNRACYEYSKLQWNMSGFGARYTVRVCKCTKVNASAPAVTGSVLCRKSNYFWDSVYINFKKIKSRTQILHYKGCNYAIFFCFTRCKKLRFLKKGGWRKRPITVESTVGWVNQK